MLFEIRLRPKARYKHQRSLVFVAEGQHKQAVLQAFEQNIPAGLSLGHYCKATAVRTERQLELALQFYS